MSFMTRIRNRQSTGRHVCVGLDSSFEKIPVHLKRPGQSRADIMFAFNKAIIDATKDSVCAFKLNLAFYSAVFGDDRAAYDTIKYVHENASAIPVILDSKRTDIGNTNREYAVEGFEKFGADAVTVNPYFGGESLQPFLDYPEKGIIVLCRTSNEGAAEFQNCDVIVSRYVAGFLTERNVDVFTLQNGVSSVKLYALVAYNVSNEWSKGNNSNLALVVGATAPNELSQVRRIVGDMQLLIPGIGAQGGELEATVAAGADSAGTGMIINSSRGIIFASKGEDFANVANSEAKKLNDAIVACLANRT